MTSFLGLCVNPTVLISSLTDHLSFVVYMYMAWIFRDIKSKPNMICMSIHLSKSYIDIVHLFLQWIILQQIFKWIAMKYTWSFKNQTNLKQTHSGHFQYWEYKIHNDTLLLNLINYSIIILATQFVVKLIRYIHWKEVETCRLVNWS